MGLKIEAKQADYRDILKYTNSASEEMMKTKVRDGIVYRGRDEEKNFTVKIFDIKAAISRNLLLEELCKVANGNHEGYPKAISYCSEDHLLHAIVYDFDTVNTVENLITKGAETFSWSDRMKVALGTAQAIRSFYPCIIRNIQAASILCDQNYTPKLCDFGLIAGGSFGERWRDDRETGSRGYIDPYFLLEGECSEKTDVFAFGLVLLGLITKIVASAEKDTDTDFMAWARKKYKRADRKINLPSIVHASLRSQEHYFPNDGHGATRLALKCITEDPDKRPTMEEVVKTLKGLKIVRKYLYDMIQ